MTSLSYSCNSQADISESVRYCVKYISGITHKVCFSTGETNLKNMSKHYETVAMPNRTYHNKNRKIHWISYRKSSIKETKYWRDCDSWEGMSIVFHLDMSRQSIIVSIINGLPGTFRMEDVSSRLDRIHAQTCAGQFLTVLLGALKKTLHLWFILFL